jgi:hypothetical protein
MLRGRIFFPLLNHKEERMEEPKGILPNTKWIVAHFAILCTRKLAHLNAFKAFQL